MPRRRFGRERVEAQDGEALPPDRRLATRPLANWRPGIAPCHVRQDPTLIQEDQTVRIDRRNFLAEVIAFGGDIWRSGTLYLLPRESFRPSPFFPGGPDSSEWASPEEVRAWLLDWYEMRLMVPPSKST